MSYKIIDTTFAPIFKEHIYSKIEKNKKEIEKLTKQIEENDKKPNPSQQNKNDETKMKIQLYKDLNQVYEDFFKKTYGGKTKQTRNNKKKIRKTINKK
jgi:hypothetical protein